MSTLPGKPIPFRKNKRRSVGSLVRPMARIIPAKHVAVSGETVISSLEPPVARQSAA